MLTRAAAGDESAFKATLKAISMYNDCNAIPPSVVGADRVAAIRNFAHGIDTVVKNSTMRDYVSVMSCIVCAPT